MMFYRWKINPSLEEQAIRNDLPNGDHNLDTKLVTKT